MTIVDLRLVDFPIILRWFFDPLQSSWHDVTISNNESSSDVQNFVQLPVFALDIERQRRRSACRPACPYTFLALHGYDRQRVDTFRFAVTDGLQDWDDVCHLLLHIQRWHLLAHIIYLSFQRMRRYSRWSLQLEFMVTKPRVYHVFTRRWSP